MEEEVPGNPSPRRDAPHFALNPTYQDRAVPLVMALLQATEHGILLSDLDGEDIVANQRMGELFGIPPEEVVTSHPDAIRARLRGVLTDPDAFEKRLKETYADPHLTYTDEIALRLDPPRILQRFTGPVHDAEGVVFGRIWTFQDITQTRRLQIALQQQLQARTEDFATTSETLQAINEISRFVAQSLDTPLLLERLTQELHRLYPQESVAILLRSKDGKAAEGVAIPVERPLRQLSLQLTQDSWLMQALQQSLTTKEPPRFQFTPHRGVLARLLKCRALMALPLRFSEETLGLLIFGSRQEAVTLEPQRQAHLDALTAQVALTLQAHRTQKELRETLQTLRATQNRVVEMEKLDTAGALAASVARDIRNILTTIQMELASVPEPVAEALGVHVNRFTALTHRLLAFEQGEVLETRPTSLKEVLGRVIPLLAEQAELHGVDIQADLPADLPTVAADSSQMENLFVNLCLNGIQAMSSSGGVLTIRGVPCESWVEIEIQDEGNGIALELQERIFEPFFTTRANGFGLGLFSCKRIVERHGGQLTVESAPGAGSRFHVLLPALVSYQPL